MGTVPLPPGSQRHLLPHPIWEGPTQQEGEAMGSCRSALCRDLQFGERIKQVGFPSPTSASALE